MPKRTPPTITPKPLTPNVRMEVRIIVEDTDINDGSSKILTGQQELIEPVSTEDIENALFSLAVATVNAAAWDIGLGEIFEVIEDEG